MPETTDATAASARGATVVDAMRMDALASVVNSASDDDDDDDEYEWEEAQPENMGLSLPVSNPLVDIDAEYEPAGSPKSITGDLPGFGTEMDFMRAQFNELSAALRVQERLLRWQQDLQEQSDALRSTAEALRAAHLSR
jgi:hypothetical protein